jgi:hypothetical protein
MPFNGSGTFTIVNQFVPNTTILSAAVNQNFSDIATGLSDCLTRDGQAGMTAALKAISGSVSAPGITFNSDATSGLYLSASGVPGFVSHSLGMLLNTVLYSATSATVGSGGSGYAVGDTFTIPGTGVLAATFTVATLSGSAVSTVTVAYPGFYSVKPTNPAAQGSTSGSGTGVTLNVTYNDPLSADYRALFTDQANALLWQKFGSSSFVSALMSSANAYNYIRSLVTFGSGLSLSNLTDPPTVTTTVSPTLLANYISGLTITVAGGVGNFGVTTGVANNSTNTTIMSLTSTIAKNTSSWVVGTGNGGLDTGAIANSTWYHVFQIERPDTGVVDVCFSTSATAPTTGGAIPAAYTLFRRIGSIRTDGSAHFIAQTQTGNLFIWAVSTLDINAGNNNGARTSQTLTVPTGVAVRALYRGAIVTGAGGQMATMFTSLIENDQAPTAVFSDLSIVANASQAGQFETLTNTAAQIGFRTNSTTGTVTVNTYGWIDTRGQ